jgi:hypothetical protein
MGYSPASAIPLSSFGAPTANISMNTHKFTSLLDGTTALDSAGWDQLPSAAIQYAYVASGCVWTADAPASTRNASMTAGTVIIGGLLYSVGAITAHTFAASSDTYVDINIVSAAAVVNFTAVANNTLTPALVSSGTVLNTIRIALVITTASAITSTAVGINQGNTSFVSATAQGSTTVAAGSNGANITAGTLSVAASTSFPSGGGWAIVTHTGGATPYLIQFTGTGAGTLTGVTVIFGTGTVSTGDAVNGTIPIGPNDMLGNLFFVTTPYPKVISYTQFQNSLTTTQTAAVQIQAVSGGTFLTPFVIPAGASRLIRMEVNLAFVSSSAAAGSKVTITGVLNNGNTTMAVGVNNVAVASDGQMVYITGVALLAPGTYNGGVIMQQNAAGTLTVGATYLNSNMSIEYA